VLAAIASLVVATAVFVFVIRLGEPLGVDQGLFACFTRWVPRGWLPYRDLFDSKPPLFLYWWALPAAVPGELGRAIWWTEGLWLAATSIVAFRVARALFGATAGVATAALLLVGLSAPGFGGFWSRAQAEELLVLPMLASLSWALRPGLRAAFVAGGLVGVCGLFKIPSMAIAGAWVVLFAVRHPRREATLRTGLLGLGVAVPWALAVGWFAAHGALRAFVDGVFVYHRHNAAFIAPPWDAVLEGFSRELLDTAPLLVAAASFGLFVLLRRRAPEGYWLAALVAVTCAAVVLQRQLAGYHFLLTVPALALVGGYGTAVAARAIARRGRVRVVGALTALVLLALGARTAASYAKAYGPGLAYTLGRVDRPRYLLTIQLGNYSNLMEEEAARYLAREAPKEAGVFVWGLSPGIYALADRHPTTRYPFHKLLYTEAPLSRMIPGLEARRAELLTRLDRDPPLFVLVGRGDGNAFDPLESYRSLQRFPALDDRLRRDYALTTQIGRFLVYRRKP